jgi:hypothetical protein
VAPANLSRCYVRFESTVVHLQASILSDLQLCFDVVEFGPEVDAVVRSMARCNILAQVTVLQYLLYAASSWFI